MEVKINKEIRSYNESAILGLSFRQAMGAITACFSAAFVYMTLDGVLADMLRNWCSVLAAVPFAAFGFFTYNGLNAEQFMKVFLQHELLMPKKLVFRSSSLYSAWIKSINRKPRR